VRQLCYGSQMLNSTPHTARTHARVHTHTKIFPRLSDRSTSTTLGACGSIVKRFFGIISNRTEKTVSIIKKNEGPDIKNVCR
jgi:hypothetical protein